MPEDGALLDAVFDHVPVGLAVFGPDGRPARTNPALGEMLADTGPLAVAARQVRDGGVPLRDVAVDGPDEERRFAADLVPVGGGTGAPVVLAVVSETTGERRAAEASSLLDAVYAATPVGLGFWSPELRYVRVNDELARINGLPAAEHPGRSLDEVLGPFAPEVERHMRHAIATRAPVEAVHARRRVTGEEAAPHDYEASYYPVIGADGELLGVGGVISDVTERHAAQSERTRLLKDALTARAHSEAAQLRAEDAQFAAEEARARTEFLAEAGRRLAASMEIGPTLQAMAELAVPVLADWCVVTLTTAGGGLENVAAAHSSAEGQELVDEFCRLHPPDPAARTGVAEVVRTGRPLGLDEITDTMLEEAARDEEHLRLLRALRFGAELILPLRTSEGSIGALSLVRDHGWPFGTEDRMLAEELASRAALHVNHARLYAERTRIARALQSGLLPRALPAIEGVEVAARYEAAGAENQVGGDFYDVFAVPGGAWVALVGDVSGKGPEAAAVTSLARHTLRTMLGQGASLRDAMIVLNGALREQVSDRFCTVVCVRLEPADGGVRVDLAAGGHPPALIRRADGSVEALEASGTLLGALPRNVVGERSDRLGPGDALLLYTDGLVELRGQTSEFGERWLPQALAAVPAGPLDEMLGRLMAEAVALQEGRARDDLALLALRAHGA